MGLAGRKVKQRIPADPRNLSWADDASRFGQAYLSKFGWDATQGVGLGASGDGMKSHLKVSQKLDMLGIGAAHQKDPHGIAWKQNKDFEALLKRLNEGTSKDGAKEEKNSVVEQGGFVSAVEASEDTTIPKDKKRKHLDKDHGSEERSKRKRKHKSETQSTSVRSATKDKLLNEPIQNTPTSVSMDSTETNNPRPKVKGRPMAHRARIQAAKRLATKSTTALSEILGIVPSSSTPISSSSVTPLRSSPAPESPSTPEDTRPSLEKLTTSTKSLADYFKDKLAAKKFTVSTPTLPSGDDDYDTPRSGLGASRTPSGVDEGSQRIGLGFVSSTLTGTPSPPSLESTSITQGTPAPVITNLGSQAQSRDDQDNHKNKKRKKDKKSKALEVNEDPGVEGGDKKRELQARLEADNKDAGQQSIGKNTEDAKIENDSRHRKLADTIVKAEDPKRKRTGTITGSDKIKRKSKKRSEQDTLAQ